jgi:hypothetical protein
VDRFCEYFHGRFRRLIAKLQNKEMFVSFSFKKRNPIRAYLSIRIPAQAKPKYTPYHTLYGCIMYSMSLCTYFGQDQLGSQRAVCFPHFSPVFCPFSSLYTAYCIQLHVRVSTVRYCLLLSCIFQFLYTGYLFLHTNTVPVSTHVKNKYFDFLS